MSDYVKRFLNRKNCVDLLPLFATAKDCHKEITESMGMLEAVRAFSDPGLPDEKKLVLVVGDGKTPRTAGLIAFNTKMLCVSVDPELNLVFCQDWFNETSATRIELHKNKIEELTYCEIDETEAIIIYPHSHAPMEFLDPRVKAKSVITISMPCCIPIPNCMKSQRHITYVDKNILSGRNTIHVWHHVMNEKGVMRNAIGIHRS